MSQKKRRKPNQVFFDSVNKLNLHREMKVLILLIAIVVFAAILLLLLFVVLPALIHTAHLGQVTPVTPTPKPTAAPTPTTPATTSPAFSIPTPPIWAVPIVAIVIAAVIVVYNARKGSKGSARKDSRRGKKNKLNPVLIFLLKVVLAVVLPFIANLVFGWKLSLSSEIFWFAVILVGTVVFGVGRLFKI